MGCIVSSLILGGFHGSVQLNWQFLREVRKNAFFYNKIIHTLFCPKVPKTILPVGQTNYGSGIGIGLARWFAPAQH
jgi:hypothetical protein